MVILRPRLNLAAPSGNQRSIPMKVLCVVGARPNFMKVAPVHAALEAQGDTSVLVHTGQHYDERMSEVFFRELGMPTPQVNLGVGSASHAVQTARIMEAFEPVLLAERPTAVLVAGDVNSTIACAMVATKLGVGVFHVEAGPHSRAPRGPRGVARSGFFPSLDLDATYVIDRDGYSTFATETDRIASLSFPLPLFEGRRTRSELRPAPSPLPEAGLVPDQLSPPHLRKRAVPRL